MCCYVNWTKKQNRKLNRWQPRFRHLNSLRVAAKSTRGYKKQLPRNCATISQIYRSLKWKISKCQVDSTRYGVLCQWRQPEVWRISIDVFFRAGFDTNKQAVIDKIVAAERVRRAYFLQVLHQHSVFLAPTFRLEAFACAFSVTYFLARKTRSSSHRSMWLTLKLRLRREKSWPMLLR